MVTMADVAAVAGVSQTTVSHVLNSTRVVSDHTRESVLRAIASTGYRRNALAHSLATSRTLTLGLASSSATNPYFADLVRSVEAGARAAGYSLVVGDTWEDGEQEQRVVQQLVDRQVDGLLLVPSPDAIHQALPFLASTGVPVVLLDRFTDVELDQVAPDNDSPTALLTGHLADLGHRRIAIVAGREGLHSTEERLAGHLKVVADRGLDPDPSLVLRGGSQVHEAERAVLGLLRAGRQPDALVVANNAMTIGTLRALRTLGLRVPQDMPLVCYDDFEWSDLFEPRLTAISQDVPAMGARAVELVVERIHGRVDPPRRERIATTYHHRTSCGCPGATGH